MQGLQVDDGMAVAIAAQACLPILHLGLPCYDGFKGIVVHPDIVVAQREVMDEDGIVLRYDEELAGEAMEGGPVMLSWRDVADAGETAASGYNVVIHEFAHVLDQSHGGANGAPWLPGRQRRERWARVMQAEFDRLQTQLANGEMTLLDPYGAQNAAEFFAVACETFFEKPVELASQQAPLYALLQSLFGVDPALWRSSHGLSRN